MIELQFNNKPCLFFAPKNGKISQTSRQASKFARIGKLAGHWTEHEKKLVKWTEKGSPEAFACMLMAQTGIRIGNEDSASGYVSQIKEKEGQFLQTFGATTLRPEHIKIEKSNLILNFLGKKAVEQRILVSHPILKKWGKHWLTQTNSKWLPISENDVRKFIKKHIDRRIAIKDFRAFCANCHAYLIYQEQIAPKSLPNTKGELRKEIKEILIMVSEKLGNTPAVCKTAYISPMFLDWVEQKRGTIIAQRAIESQTRKQERENKWQQMNIDRVARGLPRKYRKRRKRTKT